VTYSLIACIKFYKPISRVVFVPMNETSNEKRGRRRPNLTWEESMKRDLKDWSITKELPLDRREWKLVIHVPEP
jgi:hypothetical protein